MTDLPHDPEQENSAAPQADTITTPPVTDDNAPAAPLTEAGGDVPAGEPPADAEAESPALSTEESSQTPTAVEQAVEDGLDDGEEAAQSPDGEQALEDNAPAPKGYDFFADVEGARSLAHIVESGTRFQTPLNALTRLEQSVMDLPADLQLLHERHVIYPVAIGEEIGRLTHRLRAAAADARQLAAREEAFLEPRVAALWAQITANDAAIAADGYLPHAEAIVAALHEAEKLKARMERGEHDVQDAFSDISNQLRPITRRVGALTQAATYLQEASWERSGGEAVRAADEAIYHRTAKEDQRGILFITDQRLIFEQREEVESGILFLKRRKFVKEVKLTAPLVEVRILSVEGHTLHLKLGFTPSTTARFTVASAEEMGELIIEN